MKITELPALALAVGLAIGQSDAAIAQASAAARTAPLDSTAIYTIRVAVEGTGFTAANTCRLDGPTGVAPASSSSPRDSLRILLLSGDTAAGAPMDLRIGFNVAEAGGARALPRGAKVLEHGSSRRGMAGAQVLIEKINGGTICAITLPAVAGNAPVRMSAPMRGRRGDEAVVSIGASFDFLDGVHATDLYADTRVFIPRALTANWGIQGGIYQGRLSSDPDSDTLNYSFQRRVEPRDSANGMESRRVGTIRRLQDERQSILGLYLGINRVIGSDIYLVAQYEVRKEDRTITIQDTVLSDSVVRVPVTDPLPSTPPPTNRTIRLTEYVGSLSFGARYDARFDEFNITLQPLIGLDRGERQDRRHRGEEAFMLRYQVSYELEATSSGIKLGGEVRGLGFADPSILIFLAKEFSINHFAELFTRK
jgi:hypothetical protein